MIIIENTNQKITQPFNLFHNELNEKNKFITATIVVRNINKECCFILPTIEKSDFSETFFIVIVPKIKLTTKL